MAVALLSDEVSDLALGKPVLPCLLATSSVRHALLALKHHRDLSEISIWDCTPSLVGSARAGVIFSFSIPSIDSRDKGLQAVGGENYASEHPSLKAEWRCVGKVCMQRIICYLALDRCLVNIEEALDAPVTVLLQNEQDRMVQLVDPHDSVIDALSLVAAGIQNLVVPISTHFRKYGSYSKCNANRKQKLASMTSMPAKFKSLDHCWLTHEDVLRYLIGHINLFSPLPTMSIEALGLVNTDILMVGVEEEANWALSMLKSACASASAVAVIEQSDQDNIVRLVGEISRASLEQCNESAALVLATLSVRDFLLYTQGVTDCFGDVLCTKLHQKLVRMQKSQLPLAKTLSVTSVLQSFEMLDESSDDDDSGADSPTGPHDLSKGWFSAQNGHAQSGKTPIVCHPQSTLIAVILQALAHRQQHIWVTNEDDSLIGIVTFLDILRVMLNHLGVSM